MDYRYEVFLSYRRIHIVRTWLRPFLKQFTDWLSEALVEQGYAFPSGRTRARICHDDKAVMAGDLWPEVLKEAARDSRCAIAIITPSYFRSTACLAELKVFRERGPGLLVPVRFNDCKEHLETPGFPAAFDLSKFTSTAPGTEGRARFYRKVQELAGQVARAVVCAPKYPADGKYPENWVKFDVPALGPPPPVALRSL